MNPIRIKHNNTMNKIYVTPKAEVLSLQAESMLCGSNNSSLPVVPGEQVDQNTRRRNADDALNGGIWK